jgi:hypothetical protein
MTPVFDPGAMAQSRDLDEWLAFKSTHFQLFSAADTITSRAILQQLEALRAVFETMSPDLELASSDPPQIFVFDSSAAYEPYMTLSQGVLNILGQFIRHRDGSYLTMQVGNNPLGALKVINHEYVHLLIAANFPQAPKWFDEGLAEYYSTFAIEQQMAIVGRPVARHMRVLIGPERLEVDSLFGGDNPFVAVADSSQTAMNYALSWAVVHYLLSTESKASDQLVEMVVRSGLPNGSDHDSETEPTKGWYDLEDRVATHLAQVHFPVGQIQLRRLDLDLDVQLETISPAVMLTRLGQLALSAGNKATALRDFEEALRADPDSQEARRGLDASL